jgi:RimJ/RimL family protein N-acetyltransferase
VVADWPRLETERLVLRRWDVATRDETAEKLEQFEQTWNELGFGLFALERRDTGECIGNTGLAVPDFLPQILPAVEIGWRLARSQWRRGLATEAARAVRVYAIDRPVTS